MARVVNVPLPGVPTAEAASSNAVAEQVYSISTITPVFGGGPKTGKNDSITPVRVSSIRGQLRFWWRATRGASYETVEDLRKREGEIWGTANSPSRVLIWVDSLNRMVKGSAVTSYPSYVLFPFVRDPEFIESVSFRLHIRWPVHEGLTSDLEAALWAWTNFGGIGARTRRGCGALFCERFAPSGSDTNRIREWYKSSLKRYEIDLGGLVRTWPTLPDDVVVLLDVRGNPAVRRPVEAWSCSVGLLRAFRQGLGIGRNRNKEGREGRSFWPEADSMRRMTGKSKREHSQSLTTSRDAFPRAELGLPIVMHFRDGWPRGREPQNMTIEPAGGFARMASPIIVKPLCLSRDRSVPIVMRLRTHPLEGVVIRPEKKDSSAGAGEFTGGTYGRDSIRANEFALYRNSPLAGSSGSALDAFIAFARKERIK